MPLPYAIPDANRVTDPETRRVLNAIAQNLRAICGETGDTNAAAVTRRELLDANIIAIEDGNVVAPIGGG